MSIENELILELCKFKKPNLKRVTDLLNVQPDFPYILSQLLYNRVGGVAYSVLRDSGLLSLVNREFRNTLDTVYQANVQKTLSMRIVVDLLNCELSNLDIPYALLKGARLCFE